MIPKIAAAGPLLLDQAREPARTGTREKQPAARTQPTLERRHERAGITDVLDHVEQHDGIEARLRPAADEARQIVEPARKRRELARARRGHGGFTEIDPDR